MSAQRHLIGPAARAAARSEGPAEGGPIVSVQDLSVSFPRRHPAPVVDGVSFEIFPGEIVALVGQSGSGKSVTARTLIGLPGDGAQVRATGLHLGTRSLQDLDGDGWRSLRGSEIGFVLQDALTSLDPLRTIGSEVAESLGRLPAEDRDRRVDAALRKAGIPDPEIRRRQYAHQLSGGLRQRALIASAIVNEPRLLIADEPTTALDVTVQKRILELLRVLAEGRRGILLITHDLAVVAQLADRVLVMRRGQIVEAGPAGEVLESPQHLYTRQLLAAVPTGRTRGRRLYLPDEGTGHDKREAGDGPAPSDIVPDSPLPDTSPGVLSEAAPADVPLLGVQEATVVFPGPRRSRRIALDGVSLQIGPGETLGVVGESGSGKSTLGRAVLGLQRLDSGTVELFGRPWDTLRESRRRAHRGRVQLISQDPLGSFDPQYTVQQLLDQPLRLHSTLDRRERRRESLRLLSLVGLDAWVLTTRPARLSGGQRQRVSIAQALASGPDLLVADEPVSALDVITQAQVLDLLLDIQRSTGLALLFISHDLGVVQHLSHRIAVMKDGRVVETGDAEEVFGRPRHPYTVELFDAVPTVAPTP